MFEQAIIDLNPTDSHYSVFDRSLRQPIWVSQDFADAIDFKEITSELKHLSCQKSSHWAKFERRVGKLKEDGEGIRVAVGPVFLPSERENGQRSLLYPVKGIEKVPVPTHYFGLIIKDGEKECYLLPNTNLSKDKSLKKFKTTAEKVSKVSGTVFGDKTLDLKQTPNPQSYFEVKKKHFTILVNGKTRQPSFAVHEIKTTKGKVKRKTFHKENSPNLPDIFRVTDCEYKGTGFQRGHLTDVESCIDSPTKMKESFSLANVCPMYPNCNKSTWRRVEKYAIRKAKSQPESQPVRVISGPLFLPTVKKGKNRSVNRRLVGKKELPLPSHFFKVIRTSEGTEAYLIPHNNEKFKGETDDFLKTCKIDLRKLEAQSGIDFSLLLNQEIN